MKSLSKNESVRYQLYNHATRVEDDKCYCRAINDVIDSNQMICNNCPLYAGKSIDENNVFTPQCCYFDVVAGYSDYMSPKEMKRRTDGLIAAGLSTHFPEYIEDDERGQKFALIEQAIIYAGNAHRGCYRKGTKVPYIIHPVEVMMITARLTNQVEIIAAAALHDVVEDTEYTLEDIRIAFGDKVAALVGEESEDKREGQNKCDTWRIRKEETINNAANKSAEAKKIMLADKLSNIRTSVREYKILGDAIWNKFNMKDPAQQKWYYESILGVLSELSDTDQYKEFQACVGTIFH